MRVDYKGNPANRGGEQRVQRDEVLVQESRGDPMLLEV